MKTDNSKKDIDLIMNKIISIIDFLNDYQNNHKKLLEDLLVECNYNDIYNKNLILSEFHVIDCIGKNKLPNATFISNQLNMSRGAISKITTKLLEKGLIKGDQLENNKKETYYTLTFLGRKAFEIHEKYHDIENQKFKRILNKYDEEKLNVINNFLDDLINEF